MRAVVYITLKEGVLDPQGKAVNDALNALDFKGVKEVRQGKLMELELVEKSATKAKGVIKAMCDQLLVNAVIEDYRIEIVEDAKSEVK